MRYIAFFILVFLLSCSPNKSTSKTSVVIQEIQTQDLSNIITDEMQVLDVRTPEEFENGALPNAQNINFYEDNFSEQLTQLDKGKPVLVYCQAGGRSTKAAKILEEQGFTTIYNYVDGYSEYIE